MRFEEKELAKQKEEIQRDVYKIFKNNLDIFGWDIPENDSKKSASLIIEAMEEAIKEIKLPYFHHEAQR
jgi:hydroxylamine reductase (hybrid-cluster protein)